MRAGLLNDATRDTQSNQKFPRRAINTDSAVMLLNILFKKNKARRNDDNNNIDNNNYYYNNNQTYEAT